MVLNSQPAALVNACTMRSGHPPATRRKLRFMALLPAFLITFLYVFTFPNPLQAQVDTVSVTAPDTVFVGDSAMFVLDATGIFSGQSYMWQWEENCFSCDTVKCYDYTPEDTVYHVWQDTGYHTVTVILNGVKFQKQVYVMKYDPLCESEISACTDLIANGSFEDYWQLPDCQKQIDRACSWQHSRGRHVSTNAVYTQNSSVDYFHLLYSPLTGECFDFSPPTGIDYASQAVNNVNESAYAGFNAIGIFEPAAGAPAQGVREYLQQKLQIPLIPGHTYQLSFVYSLGEISTIATDFQFAFTTDLPRGSGGFTVKLNSPQLTEGDVVNIPLNINRSVWSAHNVSFTYDGTKPAHYVTIGNFNTIAGTQTWPTPPSQDIWDRFYDGQDFEQDWTYYIIDEISVVDLTPTCCDTSLVHIKNNTGETYSNATQYTSASGTNYYLEGRLYVNQNTTYTNSTFLMGPYAKIEVANGKKLTFQNCTIQACNIMWDRIDLFGSGTEIVMTDCVVMDAEVAIDARAGATVQVTGTQFMNNYKGIYLHGYSSTAPLTIRDNLFTSNGGMIYPRTGQRSYVHFELKDVPHANIAPASYADKNVYSWANFGVYAVNSEVRIGNSDFNQIRNFHNVAIGAWGVWSVNNPTLGMRYLDMADPGSGPNYFANCDNGVNASLNLRFDIKDNQFYWIKYTGIQINNLHNTINVPVYARVLNNYLITYGDGIRALNMGSDCLIEDNELISNGQNLNNSGIYVLDGPKRFHRCSLLRDFLIKQNDITDYGNGIRTLNAPCLVETQNHIETGHNALGEFRGIFNYNSYGTYVGRNEIFADGMDWRWTGIRQDNTVLNQVDCNYMENTGHGLYISGASKPQHLRQNEMEDANNGVLLNYGIGGSQQGPLGNTGSYYNRWTGTINNHFNAYFSDGAQTPFYFDPNYAGQPEFPNSMVSVSNDPMNYPPVPATGPGIIADNTNGPLANLCTRDFFMGHTGVLTRTSWDYVFPDTLEELEQLVNPLPAFSDYYLEGYNNNLQIIYDLATEDTALREGSGDIDDFMNEENAFRDAYYLAKKALEELNFESVEEFATASDAGDNLYMSRIKLVMGYALPLYKQYDTVPGCILMPTGNIDSLLFFAGLCPYEYYDVPGLARAVLDMMGIPYVTNECETVPDDPSPKKHIEQHPGKMLVYPNPANSVINIRIPDDMEKSSILLHIFDATGKLMYTSAYTSMIDISGWRNGLYVCKVNDGKQSHQSTFIVNK